MKIFAQFFFLVTFIFSQAVAEVSNSATANIANAAKELAQSENQGSTLRSYIPLFLWAYKF